VEIPVAVGDALVRLARNKYDALVLDCDLRDAKTLIDTLRKGRSNRNAVVIGIMGERGLASQLYDLGANYVMNKPLTAEVVGRILRGAHGPILRERRRYIRVDVHDRLHLVLRDQHELMAHLINVSAGGLRAEVIHGRGLRLNGPVRLRF